MPGRELRLPAPVVRRPRLLKHGGIDQGVRKGRGFSLPELEEAGITLEEAKALGIRVDKRRRSKHPWNVEVLKRFIEALRAGEAREG